MVLNALFRVLAFASDPRKHQNRVGEGKAASATKGIFSASYHRRQPELNPASEFGIPCRPCLLIPPNSWESWDGGESRYWLSPGCTPGVNSQQFVSAGLGESRSQWLEEVVRQSGWGSLKR